MQMMIEQVGTYWQVYSEAGQIVAQLYNKEMRDHFIAGASASKISVRDGTTGVYICGTVEQMAITEPVKYLAIVTNSGTSSYAIEDTPDAAAKRAVKIFRIDFAKIFKIPKKHEWKVPTFPLKRNQEVYWDETGVYDKATQARIERNSFETFTA
jgi:hypothetical protein